MRIAFFCPAYRQMVRVQHEFTLLHDLQFCMSVDTAAERRRGDLYEGLIGQCLAEGRPPTLDEVQAVEEAATQAAGRRFDLLPMWSSTTNIDKSRNRAVEWAQDQGADLLYMVDADCFVPTGGGSGLAALMSTMSQHDAAAVGAVFVCRNKEKMNAEPARPNEVYEGEVGTGMMLIDMHKLEAVERPYFKTVMSDDGLKTQCGEDIYFCRKLRAAGLKVMVDYTLYTGHASEEVLEVNPALLQDEKRNAL